jgi:hypothetical protein
MQNKLTIIDAFIVLSFKLFNNKILKAGVGVGIFL